MSLSENKMAWKLAVFCTAVAVMGMLCNADEPALLNEITITDLRIPKEGKEFTVCTTGRPGDQTYTSATLISVDIKKPEGQVQTEPATKVEDECFIFDVDALYFFADPEIQIQIKAINTDSKKPDGFGSADINLPKDEIPKIITVQIFGPDLNLENIVRVEKDLMTSDQVLKTEDGDYSCPIEGLGGKPCYFLGIKNTITEYSLCKPDIRLDPEAPGDPITICADVIQDTTSVTVDALKTITLDHAKKQIAITKKGALLILATNVEIVIHSPDNPGDVLNICPVVLASASCDLTIEDDKKYTVTIVYTTVTLLSHGTTKSTDVLAYDQTAVTSRNLLGTQLLGGVIEVSWRFEPTQTKFQIERVPRDTSFSIADVDCSLLTTELCNVYFTGLNAEEYSVILRSINNWPDALASFPSKIETDPEEEKSEKIGNTPHSKTIDIKVENIQVRQEIVGKMAKFSFDINYEISNKTIQYEIILINDIGKWKKSLMKPIFDKNQKYSTSIMFPMEQLNKNSSLTMLAVARDIDSGIVLASGERKLLASAVQSIKPEIDNGSKGSTSTLAIIGAAIGGIACLMALVAAAIMFVMKIKRDNDGLQYPLHRTNIEQDSSYIHGLDNPIPTM